MNEIIEINPAAPAEVVEVGGKLEIIEVARQGESGPPGPSTEEDFDTDLVALYLAAKL